MKTLHIARQMLQLSREELAAEFFAIIELYREYVKRHGYTEEAAAWQAAYDTIDGMEAQIALAAHESEDAVR